MKTVLIEIFKTASTPGYWLLTILLWLEHLVVDTIHFNFVNITIDCLMLVMSVVLYFLTKVMK